MAPFRRPGLQDDEAESQPDILRPRPPPSLRESSAYSAPNQNDEDSVVSGLSAMSDLESLYLESSSKNRPTNARDHYLLAQRLPGQATSVKDYSGPANLLNGFAAENDDEEDNWEDMVYAATIQQPDKPQVTPRQQPRIDPAERERLELNRAIAESRLMLEKEQMRLAQILEDDEEAPDREKKSRKSPLKNSKKKDKKSDKTEKLKSRGMSMRCSQDGSEKPKKRGGLWSAFTGKKNPKR